LEGEVRSIPLIGKVLLWGVILVAGLDLVFGNTNQPLLPSFLGNMLTQGIDAVLIGVAILLLIFL
jgi:hypothetical protein